MVASLSVLYLLFAAVCVISASPILVYKCATLDSPLATYQLARDVVMNNSVSAGAVCFDIVSNGITLDGNGFKISATSNTPLDAIAVQYSGLNATVKNLQIINIKTGIDAKGKFGKIEHNTIMQVSNGIDVSATHNEISDNVIRGLHTSDTSSGIYVYFPSTAPTDAFIRITNNVISEIQGDDFAIGISVYYANSVFLERNRIFNLRGANIKEISVIGGDVELKGNVFGAHPAEESFPITSAILLSLAAVMASATWFFSAPAPTTPFLQGKYAEKEEARAKAQGEKKDRRALSFSVGSSPCFPSPLLASPLPLRSAQNEEAREKAQNERHALSFSVGS